MCLLWHIAVLLKKGPFVEIKGVVLSILLLAISVQGQVVVREIKDVGLDSTSKNIPIGFCIDKERQNLYMLTKSTPVDSETMDWFGSLLLWKLDQQGNILWQIPLKNEDGPPPFIADSRVCDGVGPGGISAGDQCTVSSR